MPRLPKMPGVNVTPVHPGNSGHQGHQGHLLFHSNRQKAYIDREDGTTKGDGFRLTFAHMSHVAVNEGQRVGRGELLGLTGVSGVVTGPHLHFRVEKVVDGARSAIDPLTVFTEAAITGVAVTATAK